MFSWMCTVQTILSIILAHFHFHPGNEGSILLAPFWLNPHKSKISVSNTSPVLSFLSLIPAQFLLTFFALSNLFMMCYEFSIQGSPIFYNLGNFVPTWSWNNGNNVFLLFLYFMCVSLHFHTIIVFLIVEMTCLLQKIYPDKQKEKNYTQKWLLLTFNCVFHIHVENILVSNFIYCFVAIFHIMKWGAILWVLNTVFLWIIYDVIHVIITDRVLLLLLLLQVPHPSPPFLLL